MIIRNTRLLAWRVAILMHNNYGIVLIGIDMYPHYLEIDPEYLGRHARLSGF